MDRRLPQSLLVCGTIFALVGSSMVASAAGKDAAALKIAKDAIYNDYLGTKFVEAERKLKQALAICRNGACSNSVVAGLHRDLATIYIMGLKRLDDAKTEFASALQADPNVLLNKDLTAPEIEQAFAEAKAATLGTPSPVSADGAGAAVAAPTGGAGLPSSDGDYAGSPDDSGKTKGKGQKRLAANGDLIHTPPSEQATNTPLPLYVEPPLTAKVARVVVKFKPWGGDWKAAEMKRHGEGWAIELPCQDVGGATGDFKYYIQALDGTGEVVANSGTKASPNDVPIKHRIAGSPPHLPDKSPPESCSSSIDCPPDTPGCKAKRGTKGQGESCDENNDCLEGLLCGKAGVCQMDESARGPADWLSLALQQEFLVLPSSSDTCLGTDPAYNCFYTDGTYVQPVRFEGQDPGDAPLAIDPSHGNLVKSGGINRGTMRVLLGYDRLLWKNLLAGVRLGYAFFGQPSSAQTKSFLPIHFEVRGSYFFGSDPFQSKGIRPYVTVAAGVSEVDAAVQVRLFQAGRSEPQAVDAWHKTGTGFVSGGLGAQYAASPTVAPFGEVKIMQMLGTSGTALGLQLGCALGI